MMFLTACLSGYAQSCYQTRRNSGMKLYQAGKYKEAITFFQGAKDCVDKPANNDLETLIRKCESAIARKREMEEARIEEERRENALASIGYMNMLKVEIANVGVSDDVIDGYGSSIWAKNVKYLQFRITYDGLGRKIHQIELACKIYAPDRTLLKWLSSSDGYTYTFYPKIYPGKGKALILPGLGSSTKNIFTAGEYIMEFWSNGRKLYATNFMLYGNSLSQQSENALSTRKKWEPLLRKIFSKSNVKYKNQTYVGFTDRNNVPNGMGASMWAYNVHNSFYFGEWKNGNQDGTSIYIAGGNGIVNCPKACFYVGGNRNNSLSENGRCYDKYGNLIYYGLFSGSRPTSVYPSSSGSSFRFVCQECDGDIYLGETLDGKRSGYGIYVWKDGDAWYGPWSNGERMGKGVLLYSDGRVKAAAYYGE